ncbi:unnamed protein product, partial [Hapterophycus canaliculatus]
ARSERHEDFARVRGRPLLDVTNPDDRTALAEISHFSRYALAIYTWYLYIFERPCCGACDLLGGGGAEDGDGIGVSVRGDNWLGIHEAALLRVAGLHPKCEVVHAQFVSGIAETPYCVLVDHAWRCVVVAIRGTMSLDDCLCDLQADPVRMEESGRRWGFDGSGMYAHQVCLR